MSTVTASRRDGLRILATLGLAGTLSGCGTVVRAVREEHAGIAAPGPTNAERARVAWQYFRTARNASTGLVDTSAGGGFATTASCGDQIAAGLCAYRLGVIDKRELDATVAPLLAFLSQAPLAGDVLPARFYNIATGQLMDPPAQNVDPGWSGIQIGRLLVWLHALVSQFPQYAFSVAGIVDRWKICGAIDGQGRICEWLPGAGSAPRPETGSGYEVYAAQGFRAWGLAPSVENASASDFTVAVEGIDLPIGGASEPLAPLQIAPYALLGIEFGWTSMAGGTLAQEKALLGKLLEAQDRRRVRTGITTARADFRRNSAPYTVTGSVVGVGVPWNTLGPDGTAYPALGLLSTKAAFAMWTLGAPSAKEALGAVATLFDASIGWLEGRYETSDAFEWTRTTSTNAMVLEALLHHEVGGVVPLRRLGPLTPGGAAGFSC